MEGGKNVDRRKMRVRKSVDAFIDGARESAGGKEKTFPLKLPYELWKKAKMRALEQEMTLQEFILSAI
jgi:prolyl-tRNA synthetase